jgi:DNA-binding NtrC family response regulator
VTHGLVARSPVMRALLAELRRFGATDANVLITGETGTGKDAVARALHRLSGRGGHAFITIDCPGLPASLLEAELFGHERGAFTDATASRPGRFELAGRGTVYLDRVHELPLELQPKLLRIVEQKQVERLGGTDTIAVRARVIASADDRIEDAVTTGLFRSDLYHRLRVLPVRLPPLRDRRGDVLPLARRFLAAAAAQTGRRTQSLSRSAIQRLAAHPWPGNVRELRHVIERAVLTCSRGTVDATDLEIESPADGAGFIAAASSHDRPTLDELERQYISLTLEHVRGSQTRAAAILGISRKALWEKRKRYGFE